MSVRLFLGFKVQMKGTMVVGSMIIEGQKFEPEALSVLSFNYKDDT